VLDRALTGVKNVVKVSINLLRAEEQAKEAAHQTATNRETGLDADNARLIANEQEALVLAAFANDVLAAYSHSYCIFHTLAAHVTKEQLEAMLQTCTEQLDDALQVIKGHLGEMKHQKKRKQRERQAATPSDAARQAHLLINEQTGAITLKDGAAAFHLQDLAGIDEAPLGEHPAQSRLIFKDGHPCSSYSVSHDLLHGECETRTRIHLQVPDGAGRQVAMLLLPNGTSIRVADIDLGQTTYDPTRPERGITITLKKDGQPPEGARQINLLAAACTMMGTLTPDTLRELMDRDLGDGIHRLTSAVETKDLEIIADAFHHVKLDDVCKRHLEKYILSPDEIEERQQDFVKWMEGVANAVKHSIVTLRAYVYEVLNEEHGEKEITERVVIEKGFFDGSDEIYHKRDACLQKIIEGSGLDTIINCELMKDPADSSAGTYLDPTVQVVLMEYERAIACQEEERQEKRASDTWTRYLARLRYAILDGAPLYIRARFLFSQIREAVEADQWQEGTAENPGVARLAKELEAIDQQDCQGDNDYANALHVFMQQAVAGVQDALKTGNPSDILSRIDFLDMLFCVLYYVEDKVGDALKPTTPTEQARKLVERIGDVEGSQTQDDGMLHQRERKERQ